MPQKRKVAAEDPDTASDSGESVLAKFERTCVHDTHRARATAHSPLSLTDRLSFIWLQ